MQLKIHFRCLQEMFLYVHNHHRGKTIQEQYNRKICGVLQKLFLWLYSISFWYSKINNSNLNDAAWHQSMEPQMCTCPAQKTLHRQLNRSSLRFSTHTRRVCASDGFVFLVGLRYTFTEQKKKKDLEQRHTQRVENDRGSGWGARKKERAASGLQAAAVDDLCDCPKIFFYFFFLGTGVGGRNRGWQQDGQIQLFNPSQREKKQTKDAVSKWKGKPFDVMKKKSKKLKCIVVKSHWSRDPCPQSVFFSRGQNSAHSKKKLPILHRTAADGPARECRPLPPQDSLRTECHPHCVSPGWSHVLRWRLALSLIVVL